MILGLTTNVVRNQCNFGSKLHPIVTLIWPTNRRDYNTLTDVSFVHDNPLSQALARGTGGRSSFNGHIVTVFGATGCLGTRVVPHLCAQGCQVIIPYRSNPDKAQALKVAGDLGQVMFVPFNIRNEESIYKAVKYSDTAINLVGRWWDNPNFTIEDGNESAARTIARLSKAAGVKKFLYMSALNASPDPTPITQKKGSRFLKSKFAAEEATKEYFPDAVIFRPATMFGEETYWYEFWGSPAYKRIRVTTYLWNRGKGTYKMWVDIHDVARGVAIAACDDNIKDVTIDCIGPRRYELHDLANYIGKIMRLDCSSFYPMVCDYKYGLTFRIKQAFKPIIYFNYHHSRDYIEYEAVSDKTTRHNPTLENLGINLMAFEDRCYSLLKIRCRLAYMQDAFEDMKYVPDPPYEVVH